jgi:hypothetical protein
MSAGGGDVVHRARLHFRDPQREPARGENRLDVAVVGVSPGIWIGKASPAAWPLCEVVNPVKIRAGVVRVTAFPGRAGRLIPRGSGRINSWTVNGWPSGVSR